MREFGIGQSLPRTEDIRLVRGNGTFTDDFHFPNQAHLYVLRSPHAAARIRSIDTRAALAAAGVSAVLTGADAVADGLGGFRSLARKNRADGRPNFEPRYSVLAAGRARFVGDPVVAVIADTLVQAKNAAELVKIGYEPLPSVVSTRDAGAPGAPAVWDEQPDNICFVADFGDRTKVEQAFAGAAHVARLDLVVSRAAHVTMEPRAAIGLWDAAHQRVVIYGGFQAPYTLRGELAAAVFKVPDHQIRIVSPDVGGGFGLKDGSHPEYALAGWAARKTGRPVRWMAERAEGFVSDHQARDTISHVELALDSGGHFLALRVRNTVNLGAYLAATGIHCAVNNLGGLSGVYTTPAIHVDVRGVFSNTTPTAAYRGAGRPEASCALERIIDVAADEMGIAPHELRRRNLIPASAMPYKTGFMFTYDSGEFAKNQASVLEMAAWEDFGRRRAEARKRGRLRGIGMAHVIESAGGIRDEIAEIRLDPSGGATLLLGTHNHGQGHETTFAQILSEFLGIDHSRIRVVYGDTDIVPFGRGSIGSRSISVGGAAVRLAADRIIAKARKIAAHMLEAGQDDIVFEDGKFTVAGTDRSVDIAAVAHTSFRLLNLPHGLEPGLIEKAIAVVPGPTFPNGCHVCEVEIDPETGQVEIVGYWVTDDVGRVINPAIVKGQLHGGIVQGIGQALLENILYDGESGQNLTGSLMDYAMPRAIDVPQLAIASNEVLSRTNPLGIKGVGEAGVVGALPATLNAICNALRPLGVRHLDMPATPYRIWRAIRDAGGVPNDERVHS